MNTRKMLSLVTTGALLASMAVPAFAATATPDPFATAKVENYQTGLTPAEPVEFSFETAAVETNIKVQMATSGKVYVNPYKAAVTVGMDSKDKEVKLSTGIISPTQYITNLTPDTNIKVSVAITPPTKTPLVSDKDGDGTVIDLTEVKDKKQAQLYFEIVNGEKTLAISAPENMDTVKAELAKTTSPDWTAAGVQKIDLSKVTKTDVTETVTIAKPKASSDGVISAYSYAAFHLTGNLSAVNNWSDSDSFDTAVAFTLVPSADEA